MRDECPWYRVKPLIWETGCDHQIGTPRSWEPEEGSPCMCCKKKVTVVHEKVREMPEGEAEL